MASTAVPTSLDDFVRKLPKSELHVHLEGTLEPELAHTLAMRNSLPSPSAISSCSEPSDSPYPFHDLTSFLQLYYARMSVLRTQADFSDLTLAYLRKAHSQNVIHTEMFFDPQAHTSRGLEFATIIEGIHAGIEKAKAEFAAEKQLPMTTGLIMCFLRDKSTEDAIHTLESALNGPERWCEWIGGIGLDSDERQNPPIKFKEVFEEARKRGPKHWKVTIHADVDQENSIQHIRQAVRDLKADRLDHGTNVVEDEILLQEVKDKKIGLTCCPMSNSVLNAKNWKSMEIVGLMRKGVKTTVNSDDPAYFGGYVGDCVGFVAGKFEGSEGAGPITKEDLVRFQRNAIEVSWVHEAARSRLMEQLRDFAEANGVLWSDR
ncbi:MAG: hypothetical protein M1831_004028 [Alyxoria varia]|nr:MAG: hypothetical protein M1831_004028 [Alyxoria varia]